MSLVSQELIKAKMDHDLTVSHHITPTTLTVATVIVEILLTSHFVNPRYPDMKDEQSYEVECKCTVFCTIGIYPDS